MPDAPPRRRLTASAALTAVALVAVVAIALVQRIVPASPVVFPAPGEVRLLDTDSYYHLRHARFAARHFPRLQRWDVGAPYPNGERALHAGLFDLAIGGAARVAAGGAEPSDALVERVAAFAPPILSALVFLALYRLGRLSGGRAIGLGACAVLLCFPGSFLSRTFVGFADHHVAEALLLVLATAGLVRCLARAEEPDPPPWWRPAALHALPLSAVLFTWYGGPIHVLLFGTALLVVATATVAHARDPRPLAAAAFRFGTGAALTALPLGLAVPDLVLGPPHFRWAIAALLGIALFFPLYLALTRKAVARKAPPALVAAAGLVLVGLSVFAAVRAIPGLEARFHLLLGEKSEIVREHADVTIGLVGRQLGFPGLLALAALPIVLYRASTRALIPASLGGLLFLLWLLTRDYGYAVPPFAALLAVLAFSELWPAAVRRLPAAWDRSQRATAVAGLAAAALLACALPIWPFGVVASPARPRAQIAALRIIDEGWIEALRWVEAHTPTPTPSVDAVVAPWDPARRGGFRYPAGAYGVLAGWDFGHFISAIARRPPVASGGPGATQARWLLLTDEEELVWSLDRRGEPGERVRYAMIDARTVGDFFPATVRIAGLRLAAYRETISVVGDIDGQPVQFYTFGEKHESSIAGRLYLGDGSEMSRWRLIYETRQESFIAYGSELPPPGQVDAKQPRMRSRTIDTPELRKLYEGWVRMISADATVLKADREYLYGAAILPTVKVFERVPGARLFGLAPPASTILATLGLTCESTGRELEYRRTARAGAVGRFELIVPYATTAAAGAGATGSPDRAGGTAVRTKPAYEVHVFEDPSRPARKSARLRVTEAQVQSGARLDLGSWR